MNTDLKVFNYAPVLTELAELTAFKNIHQLPSIQTAIEIIETSFSRQLRLQHPREIYPVYKAVIFVTSEVAAACIAQMVLSWGKVLESLNGRRIYRIGLGITTFDTTVAQQILTKGMNNFQSSITVRPLDPRDKQNFERVLDYLYKIEREAFVTCLGKGFLRILLGSDSVRCIAAQNEEGAVVGVFWGFFSNNPEGEIFHCSHLSRVPSMANLGIAHQLVQCAKQQRNLYPNLQFATLNVDKDNLTARAIYDQEEFVTLTTDKDKIFMTQNLTHESNRSLSPEVSESIVKKFVYNTVPLPQLIFYEVVRQCELLFRKLWYI